MVSSLFVEGKEEGTHKLSQIENWAPQNSHQLITQLNAVSIKPHVNGKTQWHVDHLKRKCN